jgi:peptide chain release factor subunit 1
MTITREQIRELADFRDAESCAVSFYFQPSTPRNKAHKEDFILIKDLVRDAMRNLESKGKKDCARADVDRILQMAAELRSNGTHAKAVFACAAQNLWQEYDLQPRLPGTQLLIDKRFHIKPLAHLWGGFPRLGIVLVDRHRARIFDLRLGELTEREDLFQPLSRKGRSDGFKGYDAGHAERRVEDEARQHFKNVAEVVKQSVEKGIFEKWILACQDAQAPLIEAQLHPYASGALLGRIHADMGHVALDHIQSDAQRIVDRWQLDRRRELVNEAVNQARSNKLGVTGLRRVLRSLEQGEVQTLLIGENFLSHAVECSGCGHIDAHLVSFCPVCGRATQEVVDVGEAILPWVIRRDIELFYVKDDPEFDHVGSIAALLRFRADNVQTISTASNSKQSTDASEVYTGRLRRFARG